MAMFEGKVAVVTGAGTGLGAATAMAFGREGASLTLVGRRVEKLEETASAVRERGAKVEVVVGDVADEATATAAVERSVASFGGVDILINNAGIHAHPVLLHE